MHKYPGDLSQGMRQRVGIARAFALQPKMLLLDEPFGMLDSLTKMELQEVLLDLWRRNKLTTLMVTHDVDEAIFLSDRVGLSDAKDKMAAEMSNGMRQRVGIARAFALSPRLLLLDEPFGMLDSLTRWDLQDVLVETWNRTKVTAIMVTHDVDEAILLADRVVMMTNGPNATIGKILKVDLPRPRDRKALLDDPQFYHYRQEVLHFLAEYDHGPASKAA
jgi:ABC-type nitrate/sulfonate/bicarbonate transport system ATPase subunit